MKQKQLLYILSGSGLVTLVILFLIYRFYFGVNAIIGNNSAVIYIPSGSTYNQVMDTLKSKVLVRNWKIFNLISERKNYPNHIKPGKYVIDKDLS
jgi:UPF0755 protein